MQTRFSQRKCFTSSSGSEIGDVFLWIRSNLVIDDVEREDADGVDVLLRTAGSEPVVVAGGDPREGVAHRVRHHRHPLLLGRHLERKVGLI